MERVLVKNLSVVPSGQKVQVAGFVQFVRDQKRMQFVVLRDHTGLVQLCHEKGGEGDNLQLGISSLTPESALAISGQVVVNPTIKLGGMEIVIDSLIIVDRAETPLPITDESSSDLQQDWRALSLRRPENNLIFRVQTTLERAMREFWEQQGFIQIHSPKLMGAASESGSELFQLEYFGQKASLAQSPQFYKQMAMAAGFEKVFEVGPVFRANPSFTSRHDTEFTMYDVEISFIASHHDLMDEEEKMIVAMLKAVKEKYGEEIQKIYSCEVVIPKIPFPRLAVKKAKEILGGLGIQNERGDDVSPEEERAICEYIKKETGSEFVFIHDFPTSVRAFYSMRKEDDPSVTKSFDLLWNGLEITSGAQREHRVEQLEKQIKEQGLDPKSFRTYINFFRYGCPPHGGFAPGPTRMLMKLLNIANVREVTYLYRGVRRLEP